MPTPFARKDLIAAFAVILIWAMNFVALKMGLQSFTPLQLAAARFILSAFPMVLLVRPPGIGFTFCWWSCAAASPRPECAGFLSLA